PETGGPRHSRDVGRVFLNPRGFAPRTPLHALSRAASPARSVRVARSWYSLAPFRQYPASHHRSPTPAAVLNPRGFAPRTPLHALSRAASPARSVRVARSWYSLAPFRQYPASHHRSPTPAAVLNPRGFAPRTPLHALSRAASPARSVR